MLYSLLLSLLLSLSISVYLYVYLLKYEFLWQIQNANICSATPFQILYKLHCLSYIFNYGSHIYKTAESMYVIVKKKSNLIFWSIVCAAEAAFEVKMCLMLKFTNANKRMEMEGTWSIIVGQFNESKLFHYIQANCYLQIHL